MPSVDTPLRGFHSKDSFFSVFIFLSFFFFCCLLFCCSSYSILLLLFIPFLVPLLFFSFVSNSHLSFLFFLSLFHLSLHFLSLSLRFLQPLRPAFYATPSEKTGSSSSFSRLLFRLLSPALCPSLFLFGDLTANSRHFK